MSLARLGCTRTRIPESLDLEIERMAKQRGMTKQEFVEQSLRHGIVIVSNQKNLTEPNKTSPTEFDNGLSLIKSNSVIVSESTSPAKEAIAVKKIEKSLANLKTEVEALSRQVVELKEIVELAFVSNQPSNSSSNPKGKKQKTKTLDPTPIKRAVKQELSAQTAKCTKLLDSLEQNLQPSAPKGFSTELEYETPHEQNDDSSARIESLAQSSTSSNVQVEELNLNQHQDTNVSGIDIVSDGEVILINSQTHINQVVDLVEDPLSLRRQRQRRRQISSNSY